MRWFLVLSGLVVGCSGADNNDGNTDDPTGTTPVVCDLTVTSIDPAPDTRDVSIDAMVTVTFSGAIPEGAVWMVDIAGIEGTAVLSEDRTEATFAPDAALEYETVYTISATACSDTLEADFLTEDAPVDPLTLEGVTFGIQEDDLNVIEPKAAQAFLDLFEKQGGLFGTLAVELPAYDPGTTSFTGVGGVIDEESDQFFCDQLVTTTVDYSENPTLSFGPDDLPIDVDIDTTIVLEELTVTGRVAADGLSLLNPQISLLLAIEELPGSPFDECLDNLGVCLPCTSSKTGTCLRFVAGVDEAMALGRSIEKECPVK